MSAEEHDDPLGRHVIDVADAVGTFIEWWGFKAIHGRIWTVLALNREPLAQTRIAELLQVSRSLVSTAVSELVDFDLIEPVSTHRNAPYRARMDVWATIARVLRSREWMMIESARVALEAASDEAEGLGPEDTAFDIDRIRLLLRMTEVAQGLLRVLLTLGAQPARVGKGLDTWLGRVRDVADRLRGKTSSP